MVIYFVTEKFLKERTPIGENVDIKKVVPFLETAAYLRLVPVLGEVFFDDLVTKYNANSLTADEMKVVDKCRMVVAWYASSMATPALNKQMTNKGQQTQSGDFSQNAGDMAEVQAQDRDSVVGRFWLNQLKDYLKRNKDLYPVYLSKPNQKAYLFEEPKCSDLGDSFNDSMFII